MRKKGKPRNRNHAPPVFRLFAERENVLNSYGAYHTLEQVAARVEELEEADQWPEGHEALAINLRTQEAFLYSDVWEPIEVVPEPPKQAKLDRHGEGSRFRKKGGSPT